MRATSALLGWKCRAETRMCLESFIACVSFGSRRDINGGLLKSSLVDRCLKDGVQYVFNDSIQQKLVSHCRDSRGDPFDKMFSCDGTVLGAAELFLLCGHFPLKHCVDVSIVDLGDGG